MDREPVAEAPLTETENGLVPEGDGWFVVNVADTPALAGEGTGHSHIFQQPRSAQFPHFGINVQVLAPGEPNCAYHREEGQEAFLVLEGECTLLVEEEERTLRQWDFFHCAPWTAHVMVGAGDGPCAILMVGARNAGEGLVYPRSEVAARHRASAEKTTEDPVEAYAGWDPPTPTRRPWPPA